MSKMVYRLLIDEGSVTTMDHQEIVKNILKICEDGINFITLFGSRARGTHTERSDLDIAISTRSSEKKQRFDLRLKIISHLETWDQKVDVVIVEDSNWSLCYRIARDGVVLYQRNPDVWPNFLERVMIYYPDYRIFEERMLKEMLESS